jgi:hypothetical protein
MPLKSGLLSGVRAGRAACPAMRATQTEMNAHRSGGTHRSDYRL